jgi:hypothetical protein
MNAMSHDRPTAADIAAAALAATAATDPADPAEAIAQLADVAGHASTALFNYRRNDPSAPDADRALNLEMALDKRAIELRTQAVTMLGTQAADAIAQLKGAAGKVDEFFGKAARIEARLVVASAVIGLASAALVGDAGGVLSAVAGVHTALKDAQATA